jgi:4-diphosphocytidyl-2-C-methyl-D-erythritol kinase
MITCQAFAKINLFLHVLGRRVDGYHLLESLFSKLSIADEINIHEGEQLSCHSSVPIKGTNIVIKAAEALQKFCNITKGAHITIKKRIPIGAGLGGGSSDAASTLKALVKFWEINISKDDLLSLALSIGADVPFFLHDGTALIRGIGEVIEPISLGYTLDLICLNAGYAIPTTEIYKRVNNFSKMIGGDLVETIYNGRNDLEGPALDFCPNLRDIKDILEKQLGVRVVRMSGSGSTFFGIFENEDLALRAMNAIKVEYPNWMIWYEKVIV